jgi:restriction system protein
MKEMEWHQFELLVAAYERELGYDARPTAFGSDDGVDIRIYDRETHQLTRLVECKAHGHLVKIDLVRALHSVMLAEKVPAGTFYAPSGFAPDAMAFASGKNLELIDGAKFIARMRLLDSAAQARLLAVAKEGDYKTPTCPKCGVKMKSVAANGAPAKWVCEHCG